MSVWDHLHLEGFCFFRHMSRKVHTFYPMEFENGKMKTDKAKARKEANKQYVPASKRPKWCKKSNKKLLPQFMCLSVDCPFFAYTNAAPSDRKLFQKAWAEREKKNE